MVSGNNQFFSTILNFSQFSSFCPCICCCFIINKQQQQKNPFHHLGLAYYVLAMRDNWAKNPSWLLSGRVIYSFSLFPLHLLCSYTTVLNYHWSSWLCSLLGCNSVALWGWKVFHHHALSFQHNDWRINTSR